MREIDVTEVTQAVKRLFLQANFCIGEDVLSALETARASEPSPIGRSVLDVIIENDRVAAQEQIAMCQDTGMAILFVELGQNVHLTGGELSAAINAGVEAAYREGYLRKSVVDDPLFDRHNTGNNLPSIIYLDLVPGDHIHIIAAPKGFGSENMSALRMLVPADGRDGVVRFVIETIERAGANPCPPIIVGVGIGGTADRAMLLARRATLRRVGERHADQRYAELEREILQQANCLGIGPAGLGGRTSVLDVHVEHAPTHIAGMPVGVSICCHACRHAEVVL